MPFQNLRQRCSFIFFSPLTVEMLHVTKLEQNNLQLFYSYVIINTNQLV